MVNIMILFVELHGPYMYTLSLFYTSTMNFHQAFIKNGAKINPKIINKRLRGLERVAFKRDNSLNHNSKDKNV